MAEVNRERLLDCALCPNMCRCECPVTQALRKEAAAPSGKARLAHLLLEGRLPWSEEALAALSACTGCHGCRLLCPFPELDLAEELLSLRAEAAGKGVQLNALTPFRNNLKKYGSPYGSRTDSAEKKDQSGAVLFFTGCTTLANNPASRDTAFSLFKEAGVSYRVIDELCCGYPAQSWGDVELARQLAAENRSLINASGASTLVTGCPECWHTFSARYRDWGQELAPPVVDSTAFFLELVRSGRLKPRRIAGVDTVTYHDPCLWARVEEKWEQPRELLGLIPGLTLVEAVPAKQFARCCGGGQMLQLSAPSLSEAIARQRLEELPPQAAVVTACPFCRESLQAGGRAVLELVELLGKACL